MKKSYSTAILLAIIWILLSAAAVVEGCGWREVDRGEWISFNWDSDILEVKTEEISSLIRGGKQLEIMFDTEKQTGEVVLKIWNFDVIQTIYNGVAAETLMSEIMFNGKNRHTWSQKLPGELRWIFKKNEFLGIQVELAGCYVLKEYFSITDEEKTGMFRFGSKDNISLSYRVSSTDENCIETGSTNSYDTICAFSWFLNIFSLPWYLSISRESSLRNREKGTWFDGMKLN